MNDSIFSPKFNVTPQISSYLDDIERQKWLIDNMLLMPKHEAWIRRDVQVKRASGTTRIEGASLDEQDVNKLINRGAVGNLTEDEQANVNALQAYEFIDFLSDQPDIPIDELAIREMNRIFMRGAAETLTPGVYRKGNNTVGIFTPPNAGDVSGLMRSFALWLRDDRLNIHPILKAGIAHLHFVAIHPFWDGNGRTARGLTTLILQRHGFGLNKLLSLESYLYEIKDQYFRTIEMTLGNRFSTRYDATRWLDFFAYSLNDHIKGLVATLTEWHRAAQAFQRILGSFGLSDRQLEALFFALYTDQIARSDYMEITGVSPATASRDLEELVRQGLLKPEGKTRSRIYRPVNPDSVAE